MEFLKSFRTLVVLTALLLFAGVQPAFGQGGNLQQTENAHRAGTIFLSSGYINYAAYIIQGNAASGAATITVFAGGGNGVAALADGTPVSLAVLFNTNTPISINDANAEIVTPSAVSIAACPGGNLGVGASNQCASITATFSNTHGASAPVGSGDQGVEEAITDAGLQGGGTVYWQIDTGIVTLNTGGLTTTSTTKVPTNFYNAGASARVTTTITTSTNWAVGISGATAIFASANSTLTAGTTALANQVAPTSTGTTSSLTAVLVTVTGANAGAGAVKMRIWGWTPVQAAS